MSTKDPAFRGRLLLAFVTVYLFWGSSFLATRIGVQQLPPLLFGGTRFVIAGSIMLLIARCKGDRLLPARSEWHGLAVPALFGFIIARPACGDKGIPQSHGLARRGEGIDLQCL